MNSPALEEFAALKHGLSAPEMDQRAHAFIPRLLLLGELPIEPGQLVILAISIVITLLTMANLVTGKEHRHTLGQQQSGHEVAHLLPTQGPNGWIISRTFDSTVPTVVVIGPILIIFAIRFIVLLVITDQVVQRETVVAGNEIDAGVWHAPIALV